MLLFGVFTLCLEWPLVFVSDVPLARVLLLLPLLNSSNPFHSALYTYPLSTASYVTLIFHAGEQSGLKRRAELTPFLLSFLATRRPYRSRIPPSGDPTSSELSPTSCSQPSRSSSTRFVSQPIFSFLSTPFSLSSGASSLALPRLLSLRTSFLSPHYLPSCSLHSPRVSTEQSTTSSLPPVSSELFKKANPSLTTLRSFDETLLLPLEEKEGTGSSWETEEGRIQRRFRGMLFRLD